MNFSIKLLPWIWKIWKILKLINKKYYFQQIGFFFEFSKDRNICKKNCQLYVYTKFHVDILKIDRVLVFWRSKEVTFHSVSCDFCIFTIFKMCPTWTVQKVFYDHFCVLDKNWPKNMYHAAQTQNFQFDISLTSWPWMTLTLNMITESFEWYLEVSQTRPISLYWVISISYGSNARQNKILQIVKHFDFDLPCDVISSPELNIIRFPSTNSPDLSNAVWILQIRSVVPEFWGGCILLLLLHIVIANSGAIVLMFYNTIAPMAVVL